MKKIHLLLIGFIITLNINAQLNIEFLGQLPYDDQLSNLTGWADGEGNEYAIVGTEDGTSIVDITDPTDPVEVQFIDGNNSIWREVRTWSHYAYVVTEAGGGLLCIDLSNLPGSVDYSFIDGGIGLNSGHTVFCDENGFVHVFGSNLSGGGDVIFDANDSPLDPEYVGEVDLWYIHDGFVRGDTLWSGNIYEGQFSVWDLSDKTTPELLATQTTPDNFTHNTWLSDDGNYIFTTDEVTNAVVASYDVSDLTDIQELDQFRANPGTNSIPHNTFVRGNFLVTAYYRDGVVITDVTNPDLMIKTGEYDTSPLSGNGFNGAWGCWPYLPSGNIIVSDMEEGLFILGPTYVQACYLQGTVTDASTGSAIFGATISLAGDPDATTTSGFVGDYGTGTLTAGLYDVTFTKGGYTTVVIEDVDLTNGITTLLDVEMESYASYPLTGHVYDNLSGLGISGAHVILSNASLFYEVTADATGTYFIPSIFADTYDLYAGNWGQITSKTPGVTVSSGTELETYLNRGYYDDFLFDFNWATEVDGATSGYWEIEEPVGTVYGAFESNPEFDVITDFGVNCFTTGNGGGSAGDDDIDNGFVTIKSPLMDLSSYTNPYIKYAKWFANDGGTGTPNDTMYFYLDNGTEQVLIESLDNSLVEESMWLYSTLNISDYIDITATMQFIVTIGDIPEGHICEGALDLFSIIDSSAVAPTAVFDADNVIGCEPITIHFSDASTSSPTSWNWNFEGGTPNSSTLENPTVSYSTSGIYDVSLTASNASGSDESTISNYITIYDSPNIIATPGISSATVTITGGTSPFDIIWDDPLNQTTETAVGLEVGIYQVTVTDANGCVQSASANVQITQIANIESYLNVELFPNPVAHVLTVNINGLLPSVVYSLQIEDVTGKVMLQEKISTNQITVHLKELLSAGIYQLKILEDNTILFEESLIKINE